MLFVLVGPTRAGKSTFINTLLGKTVWFLSPFILYRLLKREKRDLTTQLQDRSLTITIWDLRQRKSWNLKEPLSPVITLQLSWTSWILSVWVTLQWLTQTKKSKTWSRLSLWRRQAATRSTQSLYLRTQIVPQFNWSKLTTKSQRSLGTHAKIALWSLFHTVPQLLIYRKPSISACLNASSWRSLSSNGSQRISQMRTNRKRYKNSMKS